jgi:hypothetical protein
MVAPLRPQSLPLGWTLPPTAARIGFLQTLHQVHAVYPMARLWTDERGLTLEDSPPPVTSRNQELLLS